MLAGRANNRYPPEIPLQFLRNPPQSNERKPTVKIDGQAWHRPLLAPLEPDHQFTCTQRILDVTKQADGGAIPASII